MGRRMPKETHVARQKLSHELIATKERCGPHGEPCEGQAFEPHECSGRMELNEVIFAKNSFKSMPHERQMYFWHQINCAVNCDWFHTHHGHSDAYRQWHLDRVRKIYTATAVSDYILNAPFKENPRAGWAQL